MRSATKWNDKGLLRDEPLHSAFLELRVNRRSPDKRFFGELVEKLKEFKFGVRSGGIPHIICLFVDQIVQTRAVQSWVDLAFARLLPPLGAEKNPRVWVDHAMLHYFVEFYWNLAQNEHKALSLLNQARRQRGLDNLHPSHRHMMKSTPTTRQNALLAHKEPHRGSILNKAQIETRTTREYEILNQGIFCSSRV